MWRIIALTVPHMALRTGQIFLSDRLLGGSISLFSSLLPQPPSQSVAIWLSLAQPSTIQCLAMYGTGLTSFAMLAWRSWKGGSVWYCWRAWSAAKPCIERNVLLVLIAAAVVSLYGSISAAKSWRCRNTKCTYFCNCNIISSRRAHIRYLGALWYDLQTNV